MDRGTLVRGQNSRPTSPPAPRDIGRDAGWGLPALLLTAAVFAALGAAGHWLAATAFAGPGGTAPTAKEPAAAPPVPLVSGEGDIEIEGGAGLVELAPKMPGRVAQVFVTESDVVKPGDPLLRLDDTNAAFLEQKARLALKAALEQEREARDGPARVADERAHAEAQVVAAEKDLEGARARLAVVDGADPDVIAPRSVDAMRSKVEALAKTVEAARLNLKKLDHIDTAGKAALAKIAREQAEVGVKEAEQFRADHVLKAPAAGSVARLTVEAGSMIGPGALAAPVTLCPNRRRVVRLEVDQDLANRMSVGQRATIHRENSEEIQLGTGRVSRVSGIIGRRRSSANPLQRADTRAMPCVIALDGDDSVFKVGQRVLVKVYAEAAPPAAAAK